MVGSKALIFMRFHAVLFGKPHESRFETAQWKSQNHELHNGALTTPICRSPFSERLFSPTCQSHESSGYCWRTQKCRNMGVPHTFLEGKKAGKTSLRKGTPRTLK